ncbi:MAG: thermonuclease family protein [Alphaproteobacteria bacterium]|nr:thermonuclease family protein [Alphaproteobacteria bacterium]
MKRISSRRVHSSMNTALRRRSFSAIVIALAMLGGYVYQELTPQIAARGRETTVHDGDTLTVQGKRIRLQGVDAPELHQTCRLEGRTWACGQEAKRYLEQLVAGQEITCTDESTDKYGRGLSYCSAGEINLNAAMVRAGYALAYRQYDKRFINDEDEAHMAKAGIWAGSFEAPWDWRKKHSGR